MNVRHHRNHHSNPNPCPSCRGCHRRCIVVVSHGRCCCRRCRRCRRRRRRRRHRAVVGSVSLVVQLCFDVESVSVESTDYDALYDRVMIHIHSYTYVLS